MASRTMNVLLTMKDMYTAKMNGATMATKQQQNRLKMLKNEMKSMGNSTLNMFKGGLGLMGVATAIGSIKDTLSEAMDSYALQAKAEAGVTTALNRQMQGADPSQIDAMADSYKNLASDLQQVGVIGDEVTLSGMSVLTNMGVQADTVKELTPLIQDLAVKNHGASVSAEQFADINQNMGKMINTGSVKALQGYGIAVTEAEQKQFKAMSTTERAEWLNKKLTETVKGTNKAMAETTAGKQQQALNNYGDALEALGKPLYELKGKIQGALVQPMAWLANSIPYAVTWIENLASSLGDIFAPVLEALGFNESEGEAIQWGEVISMVFNEVGYVIGVVVKVIATVISALITTIIYLGKSVVGACNTIYDAWNSLVDTLVPIFWYWLGQIERVIYNVWNIIDGLLKLIVGTFTGNWRMAWEGVGQIFTGVVDNMRAIWDNTIGGMINGAIKAVDKIKSVFSTAKSNYDTAVENASQGDYAHGTLGYATGTSYFKGGFTHINENNRGELVNLPNGSTIVPHDLSTKMMGGNNVNITVNVQGNVIGNEQFYDECGNAIYEKLKLSLNNM